jgi:hypothetical protein
MTSCLVIAAVISCTITTPKPTPAEAVKVLTSSVPQYIAPWPRVYQELLGLGAHHTHSVARPNNFLLEIGPSSRICQFNAFS